MSNEPTSDRSDELVYGGVCPVCGDEFTDGWVRFENLKDESVEGVRLCVISPPDDVLLHLPEDQEQDQDQEGETVTGEVVATRSLDHQGSEFDRAVLNSLSFRGLEGGTYKLVKVPEDHL